MRKLYKDIEAAPAKAYIWDLRTRYVPIKQVAEDGYILCLAYAWEGDDDIHFMSRWDDGEEVMIRAAWELLDEADAIVTYNGGGYDLPRLNTEFLRYRLGPPSPYYSIDLFATVKNKFRVLSKSMNHMLELLSLDTKIQHKGFELWTGVMQGDKEDQECMMEYNIQDVAVMEELYREVLPWISTHPNEALYMEPHKDGKLRCRCGSTDLRFKGYKHTKVLSYKQYKCNSCGFYPRERYADNSGKDRRKDVLTW